MKSLTVLILTTLNLLLVVTARFPMSNYWPTPTKVGNSLLSTDIVEKDKEFMIRVDVPGVDIKDIAAHIDNGKLFIAVERKQDHEERTNYSHILERSYGLTERVMLLPANLKTDDVEASLADGVLTLRFTKQISNEVRKKINITSSEQIEVQTGK